MSTEQQYRVIGKSGPGVEPVIGRTYHPLWCTCSYPLLSVNDDGSLVFSLIGRALRKAWNDGLFEILEAISPPQAEVAACEMWCGLPFGDKRVPAASGHPSMVVESHEMAALCVQNLFVSNCPHPAYCTPACLDRAKSAKAPECIRSACKAPPVAGGELCAAHAGQVEAAKTAAPPAAPAPAEARLERWRREHKGYQKLSEAEAASAMMVIDNYGRAAGADRVEERMPPPSLPPWTPRDLEGDIPDAWEPGGARLGRR